MKKINYLTYIILLVFLTTTFSINITQAYVLSNSSYENYLDEINWTKTDINNYVSFYSSKTTEIEWIVSDTNVDSYSSNFSDKYNEISTNKTTIINWLKSQIAKIETLQATILEKYQDNQISVNDYWTFKTKLELLENTLNSSIIDLWNVDKYISINETLVSSLETKLTNLNNIKPDIVTNEEEMEVLQWELDILIDSYVLNKDTIELKLVLAKIDEIRTQKEKDVIISTNISSIKSEIDWLTSNLDWIIENLDIFKLKLDELTTVTVIDDSLEAEINTSIEEKIEEI